MKYSTAVPAGLAVTIVRDRGLALESRLVLHILLVSN